MEDGVAFNKKAAARRGIVDALNTLDFGQSEVAVRINPPGSTLEKDDIKAILTSKKRLPDSVVLPKVLSSRTVLCLSLHVSCSALSISFCWPCVIFFSGWRCELCMLGFWADRAIHSRARWQGWWSSQADASDWVTHCNDSLAGNLESQSSTSWLSHLWKRWLCGLSLCSLNHLLVLLLTCLLSDVCHSCSSFIFAFFRLSSSFASCYAILSSTFQLCRVFLHLCCIPGRGGRDSDHFQSGDMVCKELHGLLAFQFCISNFTPSLLAFHLDRCSGVCFSLFVCHQLMHAAAAEVQAIDIVQIRFNDEQLLSKQTVKPVNAFFITCITASTFHSQSRQKEKFSSFSFRFSQLSCLFSLFSLCSVLSSASLSFFRLSSISSL